ncbi:MAG TPA: hypothetical protein PLV25_04705, partial [Opitutales bacterium]|nr:hypothetical protein [Opitutales bacterium]
MKKLSFALVIFMGSFVLSWSNPLAELFSLVNFLFQEDTPQAEEILCRKQDGLEDFVITVRNF